MCAVEADIAKRRAIERSPATRAGTAEKEGRPDALYCCHTGATSLHVAIGMRGGKETAMRRTHRLVRGCMVLVVAACLLLGGGALFALDRIRVARAAGDSSKVINV